MRHEWSETGEEQGSSTEEEEGKAEAQVGEHEGGEDDSNVSVDLSSVTLTPGKSDLVYQWKQRLFDIPTWAEVDSVTGDDWFTREAEGLSFKVGELSASMVAEEDDAEDDDT